jgi:hypothetical protein
VTINRVLCYLNPDQETAGYIRARRTRRRALELLERLPESPAIECSVASVESFADGVGRLSWYFTFPEGDDHALPVNDFTTFDDVVAALLAGLRRHVESLLQAASALEAAR